jgi:hypothetical protein
MPPTEFAHITIKPEMRDDADESRNLGALRYLQWHVDRLEPGQYPLKGYGVIEPETWKEGEKTE